MRRRLYDFFGLPQLPDSEPAEGFNEALPVEFSPDPIHIPKPVRKFERKPVKELRFHDLGSKRWIEWASAHQGLPRRGLRYIRPDDMHRLPMDAISTRNEVPYLDKCKTWPITGASQCLHWTIPIACYSFRVEVRESILKPMSWVEIQLSINLDSFEHQMTKPTHQGHLSIDPSHIV